MKKKLFLLTTIIACWFGARSQLQNDVYNVNQNTTITLNVLANDNIYPAYSGCGIDSTLSNLHVVDYPFTYGSLSSQNGGVLTFNYPSNTVTYQPAIGFVGVDKFYYGINNNGTPGNVCDTALVTVNVGNFTPCDTATGDLTYGVAGNVYNFSASHTMGVNATYEYWIDGNRVGSTIGSTNPHYTHTFTSGTHQVCVYIGAGGNYDSLPGIDSCFIIVCDTINVSNNSTVCDSTSTIWFYDTITSNTTVGTQVYFNAFYSGFHGQTPYGYYTLNGTYLASGLSTHATLPLGANTVCLYAWYPVYNPATSSYDSCFISTCSTFNVAGVSTPCDTATGDLTYGVAGNVYNFSASHTMGVNATYEYWIDGNRVGSTIGSTNPHYTHAFTSGTHQVCVYIGAGGNYDSLPGIDSCFIIVCDTVFVGASSIRESNIISKFNIYPNPASEVLSIEVEGNTTLNTTLIVRNMLGQTIQMEHFDLKANLVNNKVLDVSRLQIGTYFISVTNTDSNQVVRTARFYKN